MTFDANRKLLKFTEKLKTASGKYKVNLVRGHLCRLCSDVYVWRRSDEEVLTSIGGASYCYSGCRFWFGCCRNIVIVIVAVAINSHF